jgi:hypothetical protein
VRSRETLIEESDMADPTLHPWTSVEIGDQDLFIPVVPSLVVYTWYVDDEPESTVTHIWQDPGTGIVHHEHVLVAPISFEEAVAKAQEEAPKRNVEKIHVKHARVAKAPPAPATAKAKAAAARKAPAKAKAKAPPKAAGRGRRR